MLAIRLMQEQNIEVEALNFKTIFTCCQDQSAQAARELGVRLTVVGQDDDYLDLVRKPQFGYGKGANPCVDCRIYMFEKARRFMTQVGAQFIVSGEVLGQRPMSQKREDFVIIERNSDLEDLLLRPLSAKLLPPTKPEREGWVDRQRLYDFAGRGRSELIDLARRFGFRDIPTPSSGCALTEVLFSKKVHDLVKLQPSASRWDFELLKVGRHYRFNAATKVVVGRHEAENEQLVRIMQLPEAPDCVGLVPNRFRGPTTLLVGDLTDESLAFAGGLTARHSKPLPGEEMLVRVVNRLGLVEQRLIEPSEDARRALTVAKG